TMDLQAQIEQQNQVYKTMYDAFPHLLQQAATNSTRGDYWLSTAEALVTFITEVLPNAAITMQLLHPRKERYLRVFHNNVAVGWPNMPEHSGFLKWNNKERSIFADTLHSTTAQIIPDAKASHRYGSTACIEYMLCHLRIF